jgi:hypothetical protein
VASSVTSRPAAQSVSVHDRLVGMGVSGLSYHPKAADPAPAAPAPAWLRALVLALTLGIAAATAVLTSLSLDADFAGYSEYRELVTVAGNGSAPALSAGTRWWFRGCVPNYSYVDEDGVFTAVGNASFWQQQQQQPAQAQCPLAYSTVNTLRAWQSPFIFFQCLCIMTAALVSRKHFFLHAKEGWLRYAHLLLFGWLKFIGAGFSQLPSFVTHCGCTGVNNTIMAICLAALCAVSSLFVIAAMRRTVLNAWNRVCGPLHASCECDKGRTHAEECLAGPAGRVLTVLAVTCCAYLTILKLWALVTAVDAMEVTFGSSILLSIAHGVVGLLELR